MGLLRFRIVWVVQRDPHAPGHPARLPALSVAALPREPPLLRGADRMIKRGNATVCPSFGFVWIVIR